MNSRDGVADVETVLTMPVSIESGGQVYSTQMTGYDPDTVMHGFIDEGGDPVALPSDGVLVDAGITAQIEDLEPGDTVALTLGSGPSATTVDAQVANFTYQPLGTFVSAEKSWLAAQVPDAPEATALLTTVDGADPDAVRQDASELAGVLAYVDTSALADVYDEYSGLFYVFTGAMLALGAAMAQLSTTFVTFGQDFMALFDATSVSSFADTALALASYLSALAGSALASAASISCTMALAFTGSSQTWASNAPWSWPSCPASSLAWSWS